MLQFCLIIGVIFLIMEIFVPAYFFLNLSIGAFLCAIIPALFDVKVSTLILIYCFVSMVLILALRPLMTKVSDSKHKTGIEGKYIGKQVKVIESIDKTKGAISIYDERWQARSDSEIAAGEIVEIISNDGLIMNVKKINR